jgi:Transposase DDE domain
MPQRFNEPRRPRIPRARCRVRNWPEYDRALQRRGGLTVWVAPAALAAWQPPRTGQRGRPRDYSDVAIETGHLLRLAFGRPWRQAEGLLRSIVGLLGLTVATPDHTTLARRRPGLTLAAALARAQARGPVPVVIDATGLKVYGAGEWLAEKHGERGGREWRKLHLAVDPDSGEVLACELTGNEEGDASQAAPLLARIPGSLGAVVADGAYDGEPVHRAVAERQSDPPVAVAIPPRATAVPGTAAGTAAPSQRDRRIELIRDKGRTGGQKAVGYGRRSLGETAMFRHKAVIGRGSRARSLSAQKTEARAGCAVLNRMTRLGMPLSQRVA